jgi:hypothetical protein
MQPAKITHMATERASVVAAHGAWPPASPYVWQDSWTDAQGVSKSIVLAFRFDSPVNGGGTLVLQGLDYDLDPACPWAFLIVVKPDTSRVTRQIPRGARTGTVTAAQLAAVGLSTFTDIGSITVGTTAN